MRNSDIHAFRGANRAASGRFTRKDGFTLIELLVVIAIIAILAAIIFPVFSAVRENAREATTMSNLHNISSALALYKLDNRRYPDVLFAYPCTQAASAVDGCTPADTMQSIGTDPKATNELVGLYPEYIKDWQSFTCPNNLVTSNAQQTPLLPVNVLYPKESPTNTCWTDGGGTTPWACTAANPAGTGTQGALYSANEAFFAADAMDVSPQVVGVNKFAGGNNNDPSKYTYIPRYQTSWMSYATNVTGCPGNSADEDYIRQLRWINPPANTYVTSVTYHVPNADRLIVLYESGATQVFKKPMPGGWFTGPFANYRTAFVDNQPSIAVPNGGCFSPAFFWRYDATQ